ncbi:hypothetical protein B296_00000285 [Ensete ventricosum]|uniref:Uncharacterized protein n=1 Tax=Ensete ventricosum TaxID=4639 RepID=A0A426ZP62_ENSVE|nr:hypothetical protein B296_00000285 [Ensete ventricosum]
MMGRTYLAWCQRKGSFETYASYLRDAFDGVTKVIQHAEAKLGSGYLSTGPEDTEAGVTQEWVGEGELLRERTKNLRWRRPYDVLAKVTYTERRVFVYVSKLALNESLSHQHMGVVYHRGRSPSASTSESHGGRREHVNDQELLGAPLWLTMQRQEGLWIQGVNATVPQR